MQSLLGFAFLSFANGLLTIAPPRPACRADEEFRRCGTACEPTCARPNPLNCTKQCIVDVCQCKRGFVRAPGGDCREQYACPRGEKMKTLISFLSLAMSILQDVIWKGVELTSTCSMFFGAILRKGLFWNVSLPCTHSNFAKVDFYFCFYRQVLHDSVTRGNT